MAVLLGPTIPPPGPDQLYDVTVLVVVKAEVTVVLVQVTVPEVAEAFTGDAPELGLIVNTKLAKQPDVGCVTTAV